MLLNNLILLHLYYKYLKNIFVIKFVKIIIRIMFGYNCYVNFILKMLLILLLNQLIICRFVIKLVWFFGVGCYANMVPIMLNNDHNNL